jgi:hemerythrin-like domain-containing protein
VQRFGARTRDSGLWHNKDVLTSLKLGAQRSEQQEDAISLLLRCHDRIRHFTDLAERLGLHPERPARDRQGAAHAVLRYYEVALPLHEADENDSIYPRLSRALPVGHLAEANRSMVQQHAVIDVLIAGLIPMWRLIAENPEEQQRLSPELPRRVQQLRELWSTHLRLEEEEIIPAMRRFLSQQELQAIEAEMRARRQAP